MVIFKGIVFVQELKKQSAHRKSEYITALIFNAFYFV